MAKSAKNKKLTVKRTVKTVKPMSKATSKSASKSTVQRLKPTVRRTVKKAASKRLPNGSLTVQSTVQAAKKQESGKNPLAAFEYVREHLPDIDKKSGFEAYQDFRDFLVPLFTTPEKGQLFERDDSHYSFIGDFQPFDPAYIDNLTLCLFIKTNAPHIYEQTKPIIDRNVRPKKANEGFNHLYRECAGFLVLLLQHYEKITRRHGLRLAAHLTKYSESVITKPFDRMDAMRGKLKDELPPPLVLAALYGTLFAKRANPDTLQPFKKKSARSQGEAQKTIDGYWRFTERVVRHYHGEILQFMKKNPVILFTRIAADFGMVFPLAEKDMKKPPAYIVFMVLCFALVTAVMPEAVLKFDESLRSMA